MYVVIVIVALVVVGPAVCTSHIAAVISVNFWPAHFFSSAAAKGGLTRSRHMTLELKMLALSIVLGLCVGQTDS